MLFGNYAIVDNVPYTFEKEPTWAWEFRPATVADELELQRWLQREGRQEIKPTWIDIAIQQIALLSVKTTLPGAGLEAGGSPAQFEQLLKQMPTDMMGELWVALGERNPLWGPPRPPQSDPQPTEDASAAATS